MIVLLMALTLAGTAVPEQAKTPEAVAASFLDAFKSMDESRFDGFFAPDVTMFFPDGPFPKERIEGRTEVLAAFHSFFKLAKERGRVALNIVPHDLRVQVYGDVAVVTFELDGDDAVGRRSIVLRNLDGDWRIAHFHASVVNK